MEPTILKYFEKPWTYQDQAKVIAVHNHDSGRKMIVLDGTIFYPQGGGQPYDQGLIKGQNGTFKVEEVRYVDGQVYHIGNFENGTLNPGDEVTCQLDEARRKLHSRLHSAGHLIDYALENLGQPMEPSKGYHYPEGPYDEYKGTLDEAKRQELATKLEPELNRIIQEGAEVSMKIMPIEELQKICRYIPEFLPKGKPSRAAIFHLPSADGGERGIPCGGTHVQNLSEIGHMTIPKIKSKSGLTRISYRCE